MGKYVRYLYLFTVLCTSAYSGVFVGSLREDTAILINDDLADNYGISRNVTRIAISQLTGTVANLDNSENCFIYFDDNYFQGDNEDFYLLTSSVLCVANAMENTNWRPSCLVLVFSNILIKIHSSSISYYSSNVNAISNEEARSYIQEHMVQYSNIEFIYGLPSLNSGSDVITLNSIQDIIDTMSFVSVPSGTYLLHSYDDAVNDSDYSLREVTLEGFDILATEVTQEMWYGVMPSYSNMYTLAQNAGVHLSSAHRVGDDYPVYYVAEYDVYDFIGWLNVFDTEHNYRLPTLEEWECACKAGTTSEYFFADTIDAEIGNYCWYSDNSNSELHTVKAKKPNAWGLYDMYGNVWEMCDAVYSIDSDYYVYLRGGSCLSNSDELLQLGVVSTSVANYYVGFRLIRTCVDEQIKQIRMRCNK